MTALQEHLFAAAFGELVARASSEPFIDAGATGRRPVDPFAGHRPLAEILEEDGRARRFANLETWILTQECALRRVHQAVPAKGSSGVHLLQSTSLSASRFPCRI